MNLHVDKLTSPKSDCIIIPFNPNDETQSNLIKNNYPIAGFNRMLSELTKSDGAHKTAFIDGAEHHEQALLLYNCNANSAAEQNQQAIKFAIKNKNYFTGHVEVNLNFIAQDNITMLSSLLRSIFLSNYEIGKYKADNEKESRSIVNLSIVSEYLSSEDINRIVHRAKASAETMLSCMELVDAPANIKTPQHMADWLTTSGQANGFQVEVLEKDQLIAKGFHALLAVNRGSEDPAKCIIAQYNGKNTNDETPTIALVGKGVTFDTGGLSIKPSSNMHYMKSDMGGAAAVMGTIELVAKLELNIKLIVIVPCTDNSVDSTSIKPGDVISSYKGSTIEVIDTDAEGRLILADGLSYAVNTFNPDYLVDLATLTGSIVRTLGSHAAGLMTKSDFMSSSIIQAGQLTGQRVWPLPLWDEYNEYMVSDVADIRNLSTKPVAGAITAGKFLEHFTDKHEQWAHLDIAGTAFGASSFAKGYSASGFGILLLLSWIELIIQK